MSNQLNSPVQVFNLTTYPHLVGLLDTLGVDSEPSDMSFSLSLDGGRLEWGSDGLKGLFAQRSNMLSPSFLGMVRDILRFGRHAPEVLDPARRHEFHAMTLGEYLDRNGYSEAFRSNYVAPMCAAVWSVPSSQVMRFPVQMLIRFWVNHHLLDVFERPVWRVVAGRSKAYVQRILAHLPSVRVGDGVKSIRRSSTAIAGLEAGPVTVTLESGEALTFDALVMATHADVTLGILGATATERERSVLAAVPYGENDVVLHSDATLMPVNKDCWTSWNFLGTTGKGSEDKAVCVTYWLNRLQNLPPSAPDLFVTLNPMHPPRPDSVIRKLVLTHPVFSQASVLAQEQLPAIQGTGGVFYCGAWCGYGFHEDGLKAAVAVVEGLGARIPWVPRATSPKQSFWQARMLNLFDAFCRKAIRTGKLRFILPNGEELHYGTEPAKAAANGHSAGKTTEFSGWEGRPALCSTVRVFDWEFFGKVVVKHDTGLGESYMDDDYEVDNPAALMAVLTANAESIETNRGVLGLLNYAGSKLLHWAHLRRANTIEGSRKNIEEHYDAGNDMYRLFLDDSTMMYSAALHKPGLPLVDAQIAKIDGIIRKAQLMASDNVLEIGCGWGGFAIRAVQTTGCRITGLTLSKEQLAIAMDRVRQARLEDRITLLLCDYRDLGRDGAFDKVVSIEMIEAVGHENLPTYFQSIGKALKPGGIAVLQAISEPDGRYDAYRRSSDFIREHIFPGGHLPCLGAVVESCRGTGLSVRDTEDIGLDYAVTLRHWRKAWEERKEDVLKLGYSARFWRKYRFYFAYCEAAFDARYIHNFQIVIAKDGPVSAAMQLRAHAAFSQDLDLERIAGSLRSGPSPAAPFLPSSTLLAGVALFASGAVAGVLAADHLQGREVGRSFRDAAERIAAHEIWAHKGKALGAALGGLWR